MTFPPVNRKSEIVLLRLATKSAQQAEMREAEHRPAAREQGAAGGGGSADSDNTK
jgi:hypothetical protein